MGLQVLQYQPASLLACFLEIKKKKKVKDIKISTALYSIAHCQK